MRRMAFAVVALVGCCTAPARADTVPLFDGVPGTYTPGQALTFEVRVPEMIGLYNYVVELVFSTTVPNPTPPLLAFPTVADPNPAGRYVFASNSGFSYTFDSTDPSKISLTFSDSSLKDSANGPQPDPINTVPGTNDTLVRVTVIPDSRLTGPITITLGSKTDFKYDTEFGVIPLANEPIVVQQADISTGNPVPAPPGAVLLGIGGLLLGLRNRVSRRTA